MALTVTIYDTDVTRYWTDK